MRSLFMASLCAVICLATGSQQVRAENRWGVIVAAEPRGAAEPITLHLPANGNQLRAQLYVRRSAATPMTLGALYFYAILRHENSPVGKVSVAGANPSIESPNSITIPMGESPIVLNLNVDEINATERFQGTLIAEYRTKQATGPDNVEIDTVAKFTIEPRPQLKIAGAPASGPIIFTSPGAVFERCLQIESTNVGSVGALQVLVSPLVGTNGEACDVTTTPSREEFAARTVSLQGLSVLPLQITATLPRAQDYTGQVSLIFDGKRETYEMKVTRAKPVVQIVGAPAKLTTENAAFTHRFLIESSSPFPIENFSIVVPSLIDPQSSEVKVAHEIMMSDGKKVTLPGPLEGFGSRVLEITATLPDTGEHSGTINLVFDGEKLPCSYSVNRKRPDPTVEALGGTTAYGELAFFCPSTAQWWFSLHEKGGKKVTLEVPELIDLTIESPDKTSLQAHLGKVTFVDTCGNILVGPLVLNPGEIRRVGAMLSNLDTPGSYKGTIRVGLVDGQSIAKDFAILMRVSWGLAAILIFAGVCVSSAIRWFLEKGRPQLIRQERAARLNRELNERKQSLGDLDGREDQILKKLQSRMNKLFEVLDSEDTAGFDAISAEIDRKLTVLPNWVNVYRKLKAATPPEAVSELKDKLTPIETFLSEDATNSTNEIMNQHLGALREVELAIPKKLNEHFQKGMESFRKDVQELLLDEQLDSSQRTKLRDVLETIVSVAEKSDAVDLVVAQRDFQELRRTFVVLAANRLVAQLSKATAPYGFEFAEWGTLKTTVTDLMSGVEALGATDPDQAWVQYQHAYSEYLNGILDRLGATIDVKKQKVENWPTLALEVKQTFRGEAEACLQQLRLARERVDRREFRLATTDYREIVQKFAVALTPVNAETGNQMGGPTTAQAGRMMVAALGGMIPPEVAEGAYAATPSRPLSQLFTVEEIRFRRRAADWGLAAATFAIATLLGVKLMWASNPTWGSPNDCFTAVLWGLGLHQVTASAAFGGTQWIQSQYTPGKSQGQ